MAAFFQRREAVLESLLQFGCRAAPILESIHQRLECQRNRVGLNSGLVAAGMIGRVGVQKRDLSPSKRILSATTHFANSAILGASVRLTETIRPKAQDTASNSASRM